MSDIRLKLTRSPIGFPGYEPPEAESARARIDRVAGRDMVAAEFDFGVMGGSMGVAAGETVCRAFELAAERGLPMLAITRSGGARMQEGMCSLAQMPATLLARDAFAATGLPFIAYLRHPTTGGVYASFASTADVVFAEPGATIGFAGPRVAEAFTGRPLPEDSHTAEFALRHGLVEAVVAPEDLDAAAGAWLERWQPPPAVLRTSSGEVHASPTPASWDEDAWEAVRRARDPERRAHLRAGLALEDVTPNVATGLRGGRRVIATFGGTLGVDDFRAIDDLRRAGEPLTVLVDVPGADPSSESEAAGIARAIASTMRSMLSHPAPILGIVTGEGGSGPALALAAGADRFAMAENSYFSVIAPEGAAAILRRTDVEQVARDLRCGPNDLVALGLADRVVTDDEVHALIADPAMADAWPSPGRARWRLPAATFVR